MVQFLNGRSIRTEYGYDELGRQIWQEDALDRRTLYEYDLMGRRTAVVLPNLQRSSTVYDAVGNVSRATDFNGETTVYSYDPLNRLTFIDLPNDADVSFAYTPTGQRESVVDERGVTSYAYDERNRLIGRTDAVLPYLTSGTTIEYEYDDAGNRTLVRTPGGETEYKFDERNRLQKVVADGGETVYEYDAVGNLVKTVLPNGVVESRTYDELNRLEYLENKSGDAVVSSYDYELDKVGNRVAVTEHDGRRVEYVYDSIYRLVSEKVVGVKVVGYVYDDVGNRLLYVDSDEGTTTYTYDDNDQLRSESSGGEVVVYSYDDNGNTISETVNGIREKVYVWDDRNRLVEVRFADGKVVGYGYDDGNIRVSEVVDGVETRFLLDKNRAYAQVLEEYVDGTLDAGYVYGLDLISLTRGGVDSFYLVDGLGSVRGLTDASGGVVAGYSYDAFGNLVGSSGDVENDYLFAGEQFDGELDQYYLRQRFYDSRTGRFTRRDIYEGELGEPITLHKYLYTGGNPVNFIDPSGLAITKHENTVAFAIQEILLSAQIQYQLAIQPAFSSLSTEGAIISQSTISGASSSDLLLSPSLDIAAAFADLALQRIINGALPPHIPEVRTGVTIYDGVLTRFDTGGKTFYGYNSRFRHLSGNRDMIAQDEFRNEGFLNPSGNPPNLMFSHHAEGHAFIQAYRANALNGDGRLFIDAEMCEACGKRGGVKNAFLGSGLDLLEVYELTPSQLVKRTIFKK